MAKKQTTRRTSKSAAPKPKGPGVIASIIEVLSKATKTKRVLIPVQPLPSWGCQPPGT